MRSLAREFDLGGITFFGRLGNIESPEQVAGLSFDVRNLSMEWPAWVGIDQEGGLVDRLRRIFTPMPAARRLLAIAGRGAANAGAMKNAFDLACAMAGQASAR